MDDVESGGAMPDNHQVVNPPDAVDVQKVLRHNYTVLARLLAIRIVVIVALVIMPQALMALGLPDSFFTALPTVGAVFVFIFTVYRVRCGVRLVQCAKVLRTYPLEFRPRVEKRSEEWTEYGNVFTIRLPVRGQHGAPLMWALNAAGRRKWPQGAETDVWFAGDPPFGGVMVVPESQAMLFLNPADWDKEAPKRDQADTERLARAKQAGILERNWRKPMMWRGG
ncbi:hypothetical protein [Streptomyces sp. 8N706]|uniref:hypothetical protein n=1 Tax=Streptomyces sp. 8N706 TaxID=3457416 RepID=UPI003FD547FB